MCAASEVESQHNIFGFAKDSPKSPCHRFGLSPSRAVFLHRQVPFPNLKSEPQTHRWRPLGGTCVVWAKNGQFPPNPVTHSKWPSDANVCANACALHASVAQMLAPTPTLVASYTKLCAPYFEDTMWLSLGHCIGVCKAHNQPPAYPRFALKCIKELNAVGRLDALEDLNLVQDRSPVTVLHQFL